VGRRARTARPPLPGGRDGERTIDDIAQELSSRYDGADVRADVESLVGAIAGRGLVVDADT